MKIGIITDIHNNIIALKAVIKRLNNEKCDGVICCGDMIGIGPRPEETVSAIMELSDLIACVSGNHERYLSERMPVEFPNRDGMSLGEMEHHKWEHTLLSKNSTAFISKLKYDKMLTLDGKKIYVTHYPMGEDGRYINFVPNPTAEDLNKMFNHIDADIFLYGHDHKSNVIMGEKIYINCGSLGCPSVDKSIARAGILCIGDKISYDNVEVEYNVASVIEDINLLGYPESNNIKKYFYGV